MKRPQVSQAGYQLTERNTQDEEKRWRRERGSRNERQCALTNYEEGEREKRREGKREIGKEREIKCSWEGGGRCDLIQLTKVLRFHKCTD